jgi:hypothetical protein
MHNYGTMTGTRNSRALGEAGNVTGKTEKITGNITEKYAPHSRVCQYRVFA